MTTLQPSWTLYREVAQNLGWAAQATLGGWVFPTACAEKVEALLRQAEAANAEGVATAREIFNNGIKKGGNTSFGYRAGDWSEKQIKCIAIILAKSGIGQVAVTA